MTHIARWLFAHRADLLAALVYGCLAYLSFNALADYANAHALFPLPYGGWAFAVAIDGSVLYAFISFKRAPWLAGILLVSGAAATYTLQRWHAQGALHPLMVAGVVPALMVLVTFAWHRIKAAELRPDWPIPVPQTPAPEPVGPPAVPPGPVQPEKPRPRVATADMTVNPVRTATRGRTTTRTNGSRFTADQRQRIADQVGRGVSAKAIQRELGMSDRAYRDHLLPLVRSIQEVRS
jgi:hypothetical protein